MPDLPAWIGAAPTTEEAREAKAYADRMLREAQTGGRQSAREKTLAWAAARERTCRGEMERIESLLDEHVEAFNSHRDWEAEAEKLVGFLSVQATELVRSLRDQGRLDEAIDVARVYVPEMVARLEEGRAAIERPDDEFCACAAHVHGDGKDTIATPAHQKLKEMYSGAHGAWVYLIRCTNPACSHLNATPILPPDLARLEELRSMPELKAPGAGKDSLVLRRNG